MQNRRINLDDWRGMGEPLNETDSSGNGITVPASYYVQMFNRAKRPSLQRVMQQRQDQPASYFFSFSVAFSSSQSVPAIVQGRIGKLLRACGFTSEMKLELFATGANSFLMRIENVADTFDSAGKVIYSHVDVMRLANELFKIANNDQVSAFPHIEEMSLTANQRYKQMSDARLKWKTVDDVPTEAAVEDPFQTTRFQQQRIRTFKVDYIVAENFLN